MNNPDDKIQELKKKIDRYQVDDSPKVDSSKKRGAGFGFKISTEIVAALVVGVGIGVIVDNYFRRNVKRFLRRINENRFYWARKCWWKISRKFIKK